MRDTIRLGRIAGIPIGVNWSIIAVAAYLVISLAFGALPRWWPSADLQARLITGGSITFLFFASILGHELGHAAAARRHDVEVDGITLWVLGGIAKLRRLAPTPRAEFDIAFRGRFDIAEHDRDRALVDRQGAQIHTVVLRFGGDDVDRRLANVNDGGLRTRHRRRHNAVDCARRADRLGWPHDFRAAAAPDLAYRCVVRSVQHDRGPTAAHDASRHKGDRCYESATIERRAIGATQIGHDDASVLHVERQMPARHLRVSEQQTVALATDHDRPTHRDEQRRLVRLVDLDDRIHSTIVEDRLLQTSPNRGIAFGNVGGQEPKNPSSRSGQFDRA